MRLEVEQPVPGRYVVSVAGELDMATASVLGDRVTDLVAREPIDAVLIDVSELRFLDSSGLRALLMARTAVADHGADFAVRGAHGIVAQVIRVAALDQVLKVAGEETTSPPPPA